MSDPNAKFKRKQMFIVFGCLFGIVALACGGLFLFDSGPTVRKEKPKTVSITAPGSMEEKDAWRAQEAAQGKNAKTEISELRTQQKEQSEAIKKLSEQLEQRGKNSSERTPESRNSESSILDKPLPLSGQKILNSPGASSTASYQAPVIVEPPKKELEMISFSGEARAPTGVIPASTGGNTEVVGFPTDEKAKKYQTTKSAEGGVKPIEFIPAGSFVRVVTLNGMDAPTGGNAQSNPLPIALEVIDIANLANKHRLNIKNCRFIAAGWGEISSERVMARIESLTCIINGETVEMQIKGQLMDEYSRVGLRGRLVTKQGQMLANALFAGGLSGVGKAVQQSATTSSTSALGSTSVIDGDSVGRAALGGSLSGAAEMLAQYYLKAADKLYPVIEVSGGRTVEVMITKGAVYTGGNMSKDDYRSLLKRTGQQGNLSRVKRGVNYDEN